MNDKPPTMNDLIKQTNASRERIDNLIAEMDRRVLQLHCSVPQCLRPPRFYVGRDHQHLLCRKHAREVRREQRRETIAKAAGGSR